MNMYNAPNITHRDTMETTQNNDFSLNNVIGETSCDVHSNLPTETPRYTVEHSEYNLFTL